MTRDDGLLLYSYSVGIRSSRQIERACRVIVAFKVITAMQVPDHSTIAAFRRRHETAIGELFVSVLALCNEAGPVSVGRSRSMGRGCEPAPPGTGTVGRSRS